MLIQKIVNFSKNKKIIFLIGAVLLIALVFLLNLLGQWAISKWGDSLLSEDKKTQMAGGEVKLSGNGSQKSDAFVLKKGLTVFDFEYKGKNGFSAVLADKDGIKAELLISEKSDAVEEFKIKTISKEGDYQLSILGEGDWQITAKELNAKKDVTKNRKIKGENRGLSDFFNLSSGQINFKLKNKGSSHYVFRLLSENGETDEILAKGVGSFEGEKNIDLSQEGFYVLDIISDGEWEIAY